MTGWRQALTVPVSAGGAGGSSRRNGREEGSPDMPSLGAPCNPGIDATESRKHSGRKNTIAIGNVHENYICEVGLSSLLRFE
jgi:hypothetical protein